MTLAEPDYDPWVDDPPQPDYEDDDPGPGDDDAPPDLEDHEPLANVLSLDGHSRGPEAGNGHRPQGEDGAEDRRSSWQPVDLAGALRGERRPPPDSILRSDGIGLGYRGKVNGLHGESGDGKTKLVLAGAAQLLLGGEHVVDFDFEGDEGEPVEVLLGLGVPEEAIRERFHYVRPEEPLWIGNRITRGGLHFTELLHDLPLAMAIVDGLTAAFELHGLDPLVNKDAATMNRILSGPIARAGPACWNVDHVTKNPEGRGGYALGAGHKKAAITGTSVEVKAVTPFARGRDGLLRLTCRKDKGGGYWARGDVIAEAHVTTGPDAVTAIDLQPPTDDRGSDFMPTWYMEAVSRWLESNPGEHTKTEVREGVGKRGAHVDQALDLLAKAGRITHRKDGNANRYGHLHPYREGDDLSHETGQVQ